LLYCFLEKNMDKALSSAMQQICDEKGLSMESVIETIEAALAAAYRKDYGEKNQNIKINFDLTTGGFKVYDEKTVVDKPVETEETEAPSDESDKKDRGKDSDKEKYTDDGDEKMDKILKFNPKTEMQIADAHEIKKDAKIDDVIKISLKPHDEFGRMASQTAKQVIIQKLREAERQTLYENFKEKEKEILIGVIQRKEGKNWIVDINKATAILPQLESISSEEYKIGAKMKFYIASVEYGSKGPEIIISRTHPEILKKLFVLEIPEIASGVVEIKALAREAGSRSKIAVIANEENIDPIGACVGQRGSRIQTIINELGGEKVDIIEYDEDINKFITNALSPAKITTIKTDEAHHIAKVLVNEDQLSLAIGKAGQNVRLAAKLTGWKINIKSSSEEEPATETESKKTENKKTEEKKDKARKEKKEEKDKKTKKTKEKKKTTTTDNSDKKETKKKKTKTKK